MIRIRFGTLFLLTAAACSSKNADNGQSTSDASAPDSGSASSALSLGVPCTDSLDAIYGDPGPLTGPKGSILKCAHERDFTASELEALARTNGYAGRPFTSGAHAYRVVYLTERGNDPPSPGYTSATLLIPDTPRPGALPAVVAAHGTAGEGGDCALSKSNLDPKNPPDPVTVLITPLAGDGYVVITPDYAGYANYGAPNNPPSGEFLTAEVGKNVLDGARALRIALPNAFSDKVVLVGHSEGGHSVLSALAIHESYGSGGTLAGVAVYSPQWFTNASWGAMLKVPTEFPLNPPDGNIFPIGVGVWYHYSHGEVLDGQGHGVDVFAADKRAAIKTFFESTCVGGNDTDFAQLKSLGANVGDLYDPTFAAAVKSSALFDLPCPTEPTQNAICEKWMARYKADRPHITGAALNVPMVVMYGSADHTIPADRAVCGFERLKADGVNYTFCYEPGQDHSGIINVRSAYVNDWVASVALGAPAPTPCASDYSAVVNDAGATQKCNTPPGNQ